MRQAVFFLSPAEEREQRWAPPVDIFRTKDGWLLRYELAGVKLEDVQLQVSRRQIVLTGLRRDWMRLEDGCTFYSMEIAYSRFERVVEVPCDLDGSRVELDYKDGILLVRVTLCGGQQEERNNQ